MDTTSFPTAAGADVPTHRASRYPGWLRGVAVGVATVFLLTIPKVIFDESIGEPTPFLLYFGSVLLAAYVGGYAAGMLTTAVCSIVSVLLFMPTGAAWGDVVPKLLLFVAEGVAIALVTGRLLVERQLARAGFAAAESVRDKLRLVLQGADEGVTLQDGQGRVLYANEHAARMMGVATVSELVDYAPGQLVQRFEMFDERGDPFPPERLPGRRLAAGLDAPEVLIRFRSRQGGDERWARLRANAIRDHAGGVRFIVNLFRDVTESREREEALRMAREWFQIALRSIGDAVITTDEQGRVNLLNAVAETLTGWPNERAVGRPLHEVFRIIREDTREPVESPVDRVLREGKVVGLANHTLLLRPDGGESSIDDSAAPIRDSSGRLRGVILVFRDVSAKRAAERRRAFLTRATAELSSSLDYNTTLATVARLAVPSVADWAAVDILRDDGTLERLAVAHTDEAKVEQVRALQKRYPPDPNAPRGVHYILRTGQPQLLPEIPSALLEAAARDEEHKRILLDLGLHSYLGVPMMRDGKPFGVITLVMADSKRRYTEEDLAVATALADRASLAVENAALYREAEQARQQALHASRAKDDFLAMLGHELRNPLAPIQSALELIQHRAGDPYETEHRVIARQLRHLVRLVDDLLDVTRITHGRLELERKTVDLAVVIQHACELVWSRSSNEHHNVHVEVESRLLVEGDEVRLVQVFVNLLTNAAKYTPQGGNIWVTARDQGDCAVVSVRDDGIGIEPEMLQHVFDMFVQEPQTLDRARGGLGLGLAIVSGLVLAHGGKVSAQSDGSDKGSTFVVELPLLVDSKTPVDPIPVSQSSATSAARVLVVDDNVDGAEMMSLLLQELGHTVFTAVNATDALRLAKEHLPTVALLDIGLPEMSGYDLGKKLRAIEGLEDLRLVAATGYGQTADHDRSKAAGFSAHLVKPVTLQMLIELLGDATGHRGGHTDG